VEADGTEAEEAMPPDAVTGLPRDQATPMVSLKVKPKKTSRTALFFVSFAVLLGITTMFVVRYRPRRAG
jgi:hypothetical protein